MRYEFSTEPVIKSLMPGLPTKKNQTVGHICSNMEDIWNLLRPKFSFCHNLLKYINYCIFSFHFYSVTVLFPLADVIIANTSGLSLIEDGWTSTTVVYLLN